MGDPTEKHPAEVRYLKSQYADHGKEANAMKVDRAQHATMGQRMEYVEQMLGDSADKHAADIEALKSLRECNRHWGRTKEFEALKQALSQRATSTEHAGQLEMRL